MTSPPEAPDYQEWLPHAIDEKASWHGDRDDEAILRRWRSSDA
ncbi:hypothetical protein GCM10020001_101460 [Nonomuraea salmonea]